jgi:hypothetical protein
MEQIDKIDTCCKDVQTILADIMCSAGMQSGKMWGIKPPLVDYFVPSINRCEHRNIKSYGRSEYK